MAITTNPPAERIASCRCGAVALALSGEPIVAADCYCTSCRTAGTAFEALADVPPVMQADRSTSYVLFRKDRVRPLRGASLLSEHRLTPTSSTRRVVAACCDTPVFMEFQSGHWLSVYSSTLPEAERPPMEMRTMIKDRLKGVEFDDALPSYKTHSGRFMWRLLAAWAAMGFRAPKIDWIKSAPDA